MAKAMVTIDCLNLEKAKQAIRDAYRHGREDAFREIAYSDCVKKEKFEQLAYKKGREDAIKEISESMYHEAFEVDHEADGMQKWDSGMCALKGYSASPMWTVSSNVYNPEIVYANGTYKPEGNGKT